MVAIVGGNGIGLGQASLAQLGGRGNLGQSSSGKTGENTYVNVGNGNVVIQDNDALLIGRGVDVSLLRTYNSQGKLSDDNGDAWWINGYRHITNLSGVINSAGSQVERVGQDGSISKFVYDSSRQLYVGAPGNAEFDTLSSDGTNWTWTNTTTQQSEIYQGSNGTWKLASASDVNGNVTTYSYNADLLSKITNANGEAVEFVYVDHNLSQERILAADGSVTSTTHYRYDAQNRLQQVMLDLSPQDASITDGKVYATSYTYVGATNLIESITQTDGSYQKFTYITIDGESRAASVTDAYNNTTQFDYDTVNRQTKVTDAFGNVNIYILNANNRFDTIIAPGANGQTETLRYSYDAAGNVATITDALGHVTSFTYDTAGNLLSKTDTAGNRTENTYDAKRNLLTSTLYPAAAANQQTGAQTTRFVYDEHQQLRFQISATGIVSEQRFDTSGQKVAELHFTSASYSIAGLNASDALSLAQMQSWSASQTQTATTRSDYAYNTRGQLSSTTTYPKVGNDGQGIKDGTESVTRFSYDIFGNLLLSIDALNNQTSYTYDGLNRLLSTTDALQKTSFIEYDDANHKVILHNASGRIDTQVYDNQGHLLSSTLGGELTTSYGYDALGRLVYAKDPTGVEQLHIYDAAGNLQADVNGKGEVTQYIYNVAGQRVQTITRANALTDAQFQQLKGQVVQTGNASAPANVSIIPVTASASDMIVRTLYDKLGRVAKTISPLGEVTELQYNAAGKLVATIQRANTLNPSSVGVNATAEEIQVAADPIKDRSSYRYYDQDQRLIGTVDAEGGIVEYRYDSAGRQTSTIAYATQNKNAQVNSVFSSLITLSPSTDAVSYNFYDAENQLIGTINAEGYATGYGYHKNLQLVQSIRYASKAINVTAGATWDAVKPGASGASDLVGTITYDVLGRVFQDRRLDGLITEFTYDSNTGDLIRKSSWSNGNNQRTQKQQYDQFGRVTTSTNGNGSQMLEQTPAQANQIWQDYGTKYTYDNANRRTSSTDQNGHRTLYYYDQAGHLTQTINALGEVTENRYNHLGQLTDTIHYGTRLTGIASLTGGLVTSSLTQSLAAIANSQLDSVQHLTYDLDGRVVSMTDANGNVTSYRYNQFGERTSTTSPVTDTDSVELTTSYNKLGQVTDTVQDATGIRQTIHTDYDAFGRAICFVDANGNVKTQKFDRLGRAIEILDENSGNRTRSSYDPFDRILTTTDAKGNSTTFTYQKVNRGQIVNSTSAEGIIVSRAINPFNETISITGSISSQSTVFDKNGNVITAVVNSIQDGRNLAVTSNVYDKADLLKESTDANGNKTTYTYDDANRLISKSLTVAGSAPLVTTYAYDAKGQQIEITDPNNVKTKLEYDLKGQLIKQTVDPDGLKLVTEYSYDKRGKTLKITQKGTTQDLVQRYVFDKLGRRIEEYTGTSLTRSYQYDANNNVISSKDVLNNVTRYAYDSENRQILVLDASGIMQRTAYDETGHVKSVRRYATTVNLNGLSLQPTRAALEALIPAETAQDRLSTNTYDKDGRVLTTVDVMGAVVSYVYDANGNVIKRTDGDGVSSANDRTQWFAYDGMNRLTVSITADGTVTSNTYDGNSNVTSTTLYANLINTANLVVGASSQTYLNLVQVNAQQDRTARYAYDAANRLIYSVDTQGAVTQKVYEGSRLKQVIQYSKPITVSASDATTIKNAITLDVAKDKTTSYTYDNIGNVQSTTVSIGNTGSTTYDKNGRILSLTDALGQTESYTYNSNGKKASYTNKAGVVTTYTYFGSGRLQNESDSLGNSKTYDSIGRLINIIDTQGKSESYTYNNFGRKASIIIKLGGFTSTSTFADSGVLLARVETNTDAQGKTDSKTYDKDNRLVSATDINGIASTYTYDINGLLLTQTDSLGNINTYSEGRLQSKTDAQGTVERYSYNSVGQQSKAVYNKAGYLLSATDVLGKTESYTYNGLGQKLTYTNKQGDTTTYSYDTNGVLKTVTMTAANGTSVSFDSSAYANSKQNLALVNVGSSKTGELTAVDLATGNVVLRDSDAAMEGLGKDVSLLRSYNSQGKLSDDNGDAWWINGYRHVSGLSGSINGAGSIVYRAGQDGSAVQYVYDSSRQLYVAVQGSGQFDTLSSDGTTWTWTNTTTHQTETYQSGNGYMWKLATASDANGNVTTYAYNGDLLSRITDANGESVEFIYIGNNLSQERILAADGKVTSNTHYSYDAQNRLSQVLLDLSPEDASIADGKAYATTYTYAGATNLIDSITQTDGSVQKFSYIIVDGESRVASITDSYNKVTRFDYDTVNRQTKVTDAFGNVTVYTLTTDKRFASITAPAANGQTQTLRYSYDAAGNITSLTDALGNVTSYTYDTAGHLLSKTDAAGSRTDNTYDANGDLVLSTLTPAAGANQANGPQTTRFVYDDKHNLRFQISATGTVSEQRFDINGQKSSEIHYTNASYTVAGLGTTGTLTLSQLQSWSTSQVQSNTTRNDYSYNTRGQLSTSTTYAKINADGTGLADGSQSITRYTYDVAGNLLMTVDAVGNQTSFTYDGLNRLLSTTDALQKTSYTEYDDANHKVVQHNASGRIDTQVYDNQGHLLSSTLGGELTTSYGYDALGRLVYAKDPSGVEQLHIYDAAGNLQADVNGKGEVTQYIYNVAGQRVQTIARANALTDTQFQQLKTQVVQTGNASAPANVSVIPVTASTSDMIARTLYDKLGRIAKTISPLGEVTELQYNAAGKLVATIQRANTLNPSSVGVNATAEEIQVAADPIKDRSSYRYYDQDQKLIGTVDAEGGIVEYRYDSAGRQTTTIAYVAPNKNAQVNSVFSSLITQSPAVDQVSYNFYNAENQLIGTVNAEGYATEYSYNLDGQLTQTTRYANKVNSPSASADWNSVKPLADSQDRYSAKVYDKLGRVSDTYDERTGSALAGVRTQFFYDENTGDLIKTKLGFRNGIKGFESQTYDKFGNVVTSLSSNGGQLLESNPGQATQIWDDYGIKYTYDAANRRTSSTDQNGHRTLYYYDQVGHLTQTINALGEVTENRYNHLGQLTDTIHYGTRLTGVASLTGGLVTSSLTQSLAAIANNQLDSLQHLSYDLDGRVLTTTDANGITTTYNYDQFGERTSTTSLISDTENVLNKTSYNKLGQVTETIQDANGIQQTIHTDYDAFGRAIRSVDANGNVTTQRFDRLGRKIEVTDQSSALTQKTTYDPFDRVLTQIDAKGTVTTFVYGSGAQRNNISVTSAEGVVTNQSFNALGLITNDNSRGYSQIFDYDSNGNLLTTTYSPGNTTVTTSNVYDKAGLLKESTDANGNKTTYIYDDANRLISKSLTVAGSAPLVTTYAYDAKGQQVEITDPNNVKTKLEYDIKGQLIKQTIDPDGLKLVTEFDYDKRGKTLKVTQKGETQDLVQRYVFDKLGRRIEEYTGTTLTRSYQYDANNNVISTTDALNNVTRFAYDSQDRQILVLDAAGGMQRTVYDENGNVKSVRRYANTVNLTGLSAQPTRATLEALVPAETARDRFSTNYYDKDGRVTSTVDALGGVVSYVYDGNNNVVKKTSGDGINPANDRTQWFAYDGMNRLAVSIAADGSITSNTYDGNGNVTSTTAYANRINTASLVPGATPQTYLNQVQISAQQDRTERYAYDAANRLAYSVDAQGYVTKNTYEGTHLKSTTQYDQPISINDSSLTSIQAAVSPSTNDRTSSYIYDHAGHLKMTTDAMGFTESYTYNSLGQKDSYTNKKGATWTYTYDQAGRLETETAPPVEVVVANLQNGANTISKQVLALVTRFIYDGAGNMIARVEADNAAQRRETQYGYDALGRQTDVRFVNQQLTTHVTYDTLGNAVSNIDVAGKLSYKVYDQLGRVRFDIDTNGYLTEYKRNAFGEVETLIRYANDKRDTSNTEAPTLAQIVPLTSANDRQIKTQYNQRGQATLVTESIFYGSDGIHSDYQAKVTSNTYNAFGELSSAAVGRNIYDANGNVLQTGVDLATTRYAYNQRGQQVAVLDAENYLTRQQYDAVGNLVLHTEFATAYANLAAGWSDNIAALPAAEIAANAGTSDRSVRYEYDKNNRKLTETRLNVEFAQLSGIGRADQNTHGAVKTEFGYDELGNLISTVEREVDSSRANSGVSNIGLISRTSYNSYDMLGRVMSTTSSGSGTSNTAVYTTYQRDAYGNAVVTTQTTMVQGNQSGNPLVAYMGSIGAGQNLLEGQALYSANGRFQLVMQVDGNLVVYDREQGNASAPGMLWQSGTRAPTGSSGFAVQADGNLVVYHAGAPLWQSGTSGSGMVLRLRDDGNLVLTNASQQIVWQTGTIAPASANPAEIRTSLAQYNAFGKVTDSLDAGNNRSHLSYDAYGNLLAQQRTVTDINGNIVGHSDSKAMVSMEYDASGKLIRTVELGVDGSSDTTDTRYEYNAFGELKRQTVNGVTTLLNEYDNEGHLWRTTSGGITKVLLADQEGRTTVQVTSQEDLNVLNIQEIASFAQKDGRFTSSVTRYDHLGHVIEKRMPNVGSIDKLEVSSQSSPVSFEILGNIALIGDPGRPGNSSGNDGNGTFDNDKPGLPTSTNPKWYGSNRVQITMPNMSSWGYGDVKISVRYITKEAVGAVPATITSTERVYGANAVGGIVDFGWANDPNSDLIAQDNIVEIIISKKDSTGQWVSINKLTSNTVNGGVQSSAGNAIIKMTSPVDMSITPEFYYRVEGDANWIPGKITNFGNTYVFNPLDGKLSINPLPGTNTSLPEGIYEYKVDYKQKGLVVSHSDGKMTVGYGSQRIQAAQLYVALFNRSPIASELDYVTGLLANSSLDQVAQALLNNPELNNLNTVDSILDRLYHSAFKRDVDAPGKAYWISQWNNGSALAHGSVVADIIRASASYVGDDPTRSDSTRFFNNRVSVALTYGFELKGNDIQTAAAILTQVTSTDTKAALAAFTIGTKGTNAQNLLQFTRLFVLLQNRSPDKGGLTYYLDEMAKPNSSLVDQAASILAQSALYSMDSKGIAKTIFETYLGWNNTNERDKFAGKLAAATTPAQKAAEILALIDRIVNNTDNDASTKFESRQVQQLFNNRVNVGMLYANSFGLGNNEPNFATALNAQVTATDTLTAINTVFGRADAAQTKELNLTRLYVLLFNRAPDPKGYAYWLQQGNLNSTTSFSVIANAIWTDKFATVSNSDLVKQIYANTLGGGTSVVVAADDPWIAALNNVGQPGGAASKGEVLESMINDLVNPSSSTKFSSYARQVFTLKVATGLNFVKLGGGDVPEATNALSAVEVDIKSMNASLALKQAQTTSDVINLAKLSAQADLAATQLAAAALALEASAAALAYAKAQAAAALTSYTDTSSAATQANELLKTAKQAKADADKAYSDATDLASAAGIAESLAKAAVAIDNSLENQQKLIAAQNDLREKASAAANLLLIKQGKDMDHAIAVGYVTQMDTEVRSKKKDWDEVDANLKQAQKDYKDRSDFYDAAKIASGIALQAKKDAQTAVNNATLSSSDSAYVTEIYQYYNVVLNRFPAPSDIAYWINDLRRGDSPAVFAYNLYKGDAYARSLTPYNLFKGVYNYRLGRNDGDSYNGIDYWALQLSNATDSPSSLGQVFVNFLAGIQGETSGVGKQGKDFLNFFINQSMNADLQSAIGNLKTASDNYDLADKYEGKTSQELNDAKYRLDHAPDPVTAEQDYNTAVTNQSKAVAAREQAAMDKATAAGNYQIAAGAAQRAQELVTNLASAGAPPSPAATNDINSKLTDYNIAQGLATDAGTRRDNAYEDITVISHASDLQLKQLTQLYVLLFNRIDPQSDGLAYWVRQMNNGMSLDAVATSMYHDQKVSPPLDSKTAVQLFDGIYNTNLHRTDNDTAGIQYWANQLSSASSAGTDKGKVFLDLVYSVLYDATSNSAALEARRFFVSAVQGGVDRAVSNATSEYWSKVGIANTYALDAAAKLKTYQEAVTGSGGAASAPSVSSTVAARNMSAVLQLIYLLSNNSSLSFSTVLDVNSWVSSLNKGSKSMATVAGEIYRSLGLNSVDSNSIIARIYNGAMGRTQYDSYQSTWVANLNSARQTGDLAREGQVFLDILSGVVSGAPTDATAFASRKTFDTAVSGMVTRFIELENLTVSGLLKIANDQTGFVTAAQRDYDAATNASGTAATNTGNVFGMTTAPTVTASAQQKQIAQLYALLFNRPPEAKAVDYWAGIAISNNNLALTAQQILAGAIAPDMLPNVSDSSFLAALYSNLGGTDTNRIGKHLSDLQSGLKTRGQVALDILNETIGNQDNDIPGLNRQQMLANKTAVGLTYALTIKGDSADVARTLFANVTADNATAGINAALNTSPAAYARAQVAGLYIMMFGIEANLDGFDYWSERVPPINAPIADRIMFVQNIISGDKTHSLEPANLNDSDFINKIYNNAFGHPPDAAGLEHWLGDLKNRSRADVILSIMYDTQNSASSSIADAATQLQFRLNQKVFAEKVSSALNHLVILEQNKLAGTGQADTSTLNQLISNASVAASLAIEADRRALQAMGDIFTADQIPKAADVTWLATIKLTPGNSSTPTASLGQNSILQTNDRWGNVLSATDVRDPSLKTTYHYDSDNRLLETTLVNGATTTDAYNSLGQHIGAKDANGNLNFNVVDASGHVLEEHRADASVARHEYNGFGEHTKSIDATNVVTSYGYDLLGRVVSQSQSNLAGTLIDTYQSANLHDDAETGKEAKVSVAALTIKYQYDELGRRIKTTDAAGGILRTWYDLRGNVIKADNESHTANSDGTQTTSRFDALNHQINETNAIGGQKNWTYDIATGRLMSKTDLGNHTTSYGYNLYNQVTLEKGEGAYKKNIVTTYNQFGQVLSIDDTINTTYTRYHYDVAGNRLTESVLHVGQGQVLEVLQDNHLTYDNVGRLTKVETGRYLLTYGYDKNGNRIKVTSSYVTDTAAKLVDGKLVNTVGGTQINSEAHTKTTYNTYDAMNRQLIADGINLKADTYDAEGNEIFDIAINDTQGHQFAYDGEGRRTLDRSFAKKINVEADNKTSDYVSETYRYDAIGRLDTVTRENLEIDQRRYSANSQIERSGVTDHVMRLLRDTPGLREGFKNANINAEFTYFEYQGDAANQGAAEQKDKVNQVLIQQVHTANAGAYYSGTEFHYDDAGKLMRYTLDTAYGVNYAYNTDDQFDNYQVSTIQADRTKDKTTNTYDSNGHLISVDDGTGASNIRTLMVDTTGHILRKEQKGDNTYSLMVNDQIIGTSSKDYATDSINQSYVKQSALSSSGPSIYITQKGDNLQSIAKAVWGDATLWYLIADANALANVDTFEQGTKILIPARTVSGHNSADTFKPYNPGDIIGDTTPPLPAPAGQGGGCGGMGQLIMIVVAVVVTIYTAGAAAAYFSATAAGTTATAASIGATMELGGAVLAGGAGVAGGVAAGVSFGAGIASAAIGGAVGSIASQIVGNAIGAQDGFSWKSVALSALGAGVTAGVGELAQAGGMLSSLSSNQLPQVIGRAMLSNTITQGIGIATGLQQSFNWRNVAASGVAAGVGKQVGGWLNDNNAFYGMGDFTGVARGTVSGFAAGVAVAAMRGGKIEMAQIARDAFGNALGESLAQGNISDKQGSGTLSSPYVDPITGEHIVMNNTYVPKPNNDMFNALVGLMGEAKKNDYSFDFLNDSVASLVFTVPRGLVNVVETQVSYELKDMPLEYPDAKSLAGSSFNKVLTPDVSITQKRLTPEEIMEMDAQDSDAHIWRQGAKLGRDVTDNFGGTQEGREYRKNVQEQFAGVERRIAELNQKGFDLTKREMLESAQLNQKLNSLGNQRDQIDRQLRSVTPFNQWTRAEWSRTNRAVLQTLTGIGGVATLSRTGPLKNNAASSLEIGDLPPGLNPIPANKQKFWMSYLKKRGVQFEIGTPKANAMLEKEGAYGLFKPTYNWETNQNVPTIYLLEKPNSVVFYEEGLHALDYLKKTPREMNLNGITIDAWEYKAKTILLNSRMKRLAYEEVRALESHMEQVKLNQYGMPR